MDENTGTPNHPIGTAIICAHPTDVVKATIKAVLLKYKNEDQIAEVLTLKFSTMMIEHADEVASWYRFQATKKDRYEWYKRKD